MSENFHPSLFPDLDSERMKADEVASHIAANAGPVDYPDRTSEAARDQGWGPIDLTPAAAKEELTAQLHERYIPVEHRPIEQNVPTEEEIHWGRRAIAAIREARKNSSVEITPQREESTPKGI